MTEIDLHDLVGDTFTLYDERWRIVSVGVPNKYTWSTRMKFEKIGDDDAERE